MLTCSIVVPVYRGAPTLKTLVERLEPILESSTADFEVILVNDGSPDHSWTVIEELADRYQWVRGVDLMRNYGQHNALLCGIRQAHYDVIVTMDDDLQNPPEEVPKLLAEIERGYDVVYGTPQKMKFSLWRSLASRVTKLILATIMGAETAQNASSFRAFRTQIRDAFVHYNSPDVFLDVLLTWGTRRFSAVAVRHDIREQGKSNYTFWRLVGHTLTMFTGFTTVPLRFASITGFAFTLFGILVLVYVLGRFVIEGGSVPGFPFLASMIAIFSGAQLFAIGIIGEYLGRIHYRSMDRPSSVVRQRVGFEREETQYERRSIRN